MIRILIEWKWNASLNDLVNLSFEGLKEKNGQKELLAFFEQRLGAWFENQGFRPDEVDAVLSNKDQSVITIKDKLKELKTVRTMPEFESMSAAIKRANNLLKQAREKGWKDGDGNLDDITAAEPAEAALKAALMAAKPKLSNALEHGHFREAFLELSPLKKPVDDFFTGVMIMVEDEKVRSERLRLLAELKKLFDSVADFSKIQIAAPK